MNGDLMNHFLEYLLERDYSKESLRAYRRRLSMFTGYLSKGNFPAGAPMSLVLEGYIQFLRQTLDVRSVNNHISSVEHYLAYCGSPVKIARLSSVSDSAKTREEMALNDGETAGLMTIVSSLVSHRDRSILLLALIHGFRLRELRSLRIVDVMDTGTELHIALPIAKGRGVQYVRLDATVADSVRRWVKARGRTVEGALFCTRDFRQMSVDGIDHVIRSCGWRANLVLNSRVLRYTCKQPWDAGVFVAS